MSFNNTENSYMNNNIQVNNYSKLSQSIFGKSNNILNNDKLFRLTVELAINYDLNLPSKDKDFSILDNNNIYNRNNYLEINNEDRIDNSKLNEVMKIISKYNN